METANNVTVGKKNSTVCYMDKLIPKITIGWLGSSNYHFQSTKSWKHLA